MFICQNVFFFCFVSFSKWVISLQTWTVETHGYQIPNCSTDRLFLPLDVSQLNVLIAEDIYFQTKDMRPEDQQKLLQPVGGMLSWGRMGSAKSGPGSLKKKNKEGPFHRDYLDYSYLFVFVKQFLGFVCCSIFGWCYDLLFP